jgi:hypothetical protein
MAPDMEHLEGQIEKVDTKVSSILNLLQGHELDKDDRGMIGTQKEHERRITRLEKIYSSGYWFLIGLSAFAGWGIIDVLQKLILKTK